jgi:hypothetical protein
MPGGAGWPPTIFGDVDTGAPSEIQINPLVNISLTTKFDYMLTYKIIQN